MISRRGFTLIELLVVIAIIAILAVVVVLVLNPAQLLEQSRDSNRVSDLATLNSAISIYQEDVAARHVGTSSVVYVSLPSSESDCGDQGLPALPTSSAYACAPSSGYRATNGTGWIPVDFQSISQGSPLGTLPVDPVNQTSTGLYYTYITNGAGGYEITAGMESEKYKQVCANQNGKYTDLCMEGTDLALAPIDFYASSSLAGSSSSVFNTPIIMRTAVAGQTSTIIFSANAGQFISVAFGSSTYPESQPITLFNPSGTSIAQVYSDWNGGNPISHFTLPSTGTYTLELTPRNQDTGQMTAEIYAYTDLTGTIAADTPTPMTNSYPGQYDSLTFSAAASSTISVSFSASTYPESQSVTLFNPSGTSIAQVWSDQNGGNPISNFTLPSTGTYTLELTPRNKDEGQITTKLSLYTNLTGTLTPNTPTTMSNTYPGQTDSLTFSAAASSTISVSFSASTYPESQLINLFNPSGTSIAQVWSDQNGGNPISNFTLPSTGTYTLELSPRNQDTGQMTTEVYAFTDLTGTITPNTTTTIGNADPGQTDSLTFSGTANQLISVTFNNSTYPESQFMTLFNPSGTAIAQVWSDSNGGNPISHFTLPSTGTYTLEITPRNRDTGQMTVEVYAFNDLTGTIAAGTPTTISNADPGQYDSLTFSGTANQKVSITFNASTYPESEFIYLLNASGTAVAQNWFDSNGGNPISNFTLPATGTYTLRITPRNQDTGHATAEVYLFDDLTGTIAGSTPTTMSNTYPGQTDSLTFSGTPSSTISVSFSASTYPESQPVTLFNPSGTSIAQVYSDWNGGNPISNLALPATGTYTLELTPRNQDTGQVTAEITGL